MSQAENGARYCATGYRPEVSHLAIPHFKGSLEMQPNYMHERKTNGLANIS